jgi:hypothetical protein
MYVVSFSYGGRFNVIEIYVAAWGPLNWGGRGEDQKRLAAYMSFCVAHIFM